MRRLLPFLIIAFALICGVVLGLSLRSLKKSEAASESPAAFRNRSQPSDLAPLRGAAPAHVRGSSNASVTLEEFADFQCPACGKLYPFLKSIEREYGARVRVVFREFPLTHQHENAEAAAYVAEAAGLQERFWEMHDILFENRAEWSKIQDVGPIFDQYARQLGLDLEQFRRDKSSAVVRSRVSLDFERGRSLRLRATPTLYLNGAEIPYAQTTTIDGLRTVIDRALNQVSK